MKTILIDQRYHPRMSKLEILDNIDPIRSRVLAEVEIHFKESCTTKEREEIEQCLTNLTKFGMKVKGWEVKTK